MIISIRPVLNSPLNQRAAFAAIINELKWSLTEYDGYICTYCNGKISYIWEHKIQIKRVLDRKWSSQRQNVEIAFYNNLIVYYYEVWILQIFYSVLA